MVEHENQEKRLESPEYDVSAEAVRRWFLGLGKGLEQTCRLMVSNDGQRYHVFELRVREKPGTPSGVLMILKAFGDDGCVVAFHHDNSTLEALVNVGKRIANGTLKFKQDDFPPEDYDKRATEYLNRINYFNSKQSHS